MIRTTKLEPNELAEKLERLRSQNASDDVLASASVALDDLAVTVGQTQEELDAFRTKITERGGRFFLLHWSAMHSKIDI